MSCERILIEFCMSDQARKSIERMDDRRKDMRTKSIDVEYWVCAKEKVRRTDDNHNNRKPPGYSR